MRKKRNSYSFNCNKFNNAKLIAVCLLFTFSTTQFLAQTPVAAPAKTAQQSKQISISGRIVDSKNEEVIGASVGVKGTTNGTISDLDGAFTLNNVPADAVLVISYLGYQTQEIKVNGKQVFNIILQEDATALDEVVVEIGYGGVKRANLLGAVGSLSTEGLKDLPTASLSETLYGRLAGVGLSINNGTPGGSPQISIRKVSSYSSGAQNPLFIIDGVDRGHDQSYFDILDANDVESISILKDAGAAVYGARGAGGVVLVKTKRGKEGKPKLSYSGSVGISDRTSFPELMNNTQLATYLNDALDTELGRNSSQYSGVSLSDFRQSTAVYNPDPDNFVDYRWRYFTDADMAEAKRRNFDWLDKYWSSSVITKHNVNLSGGSKDINYYTGISYLKQDGSIGNFNIEQYTVRVGVDAKLIAGLTGKFSLDTNSKSKRLPFNRADANDGTMKSTFQSLMRTPKWMPYEVDGRLVFFQTGISGKDLPQAKDATISHVAGIEDSYNKSKSTNVNMNFGFDYDFSDIKPLKGLRAHFTYARSEENSRQRQYRVNYNLYELAAFGEETTGEHGRIPSLTTFKTAKDNDIVNSQEIPNGDRFSLASSSSWNHQFNIGVNYSRKFDKHNVTAILNYEATESSGEDFNIFREKMQVYGWENLEAFMNDREGGNSFSRGARKGFVGRFNYDFDDKYLLETSFRYESSSSFPRDKRWGFFPSVAAGWRISEEDWYKIKFMDSAKLRASMGMVGDDKVKALQWYTLYEKASTGGYLGGSLLNGLQPVLSGVTNGDLKWETTFFANYGFDVRFLGNMDLGFDFWHKNTWDILDSNTASYPQTAGINKGPSVNYGSVRAWGYEVSLSYDGRINKDMKYRIGGNLSWSDNMVKKRIQAQGNSGTWRDQEGRRTDSGIEGYRCLGIIRTQEQLDKLLAINPNYTIFGKPAQLGMLYYEDIGGAVDENGKSIPDGIIDKSDEMRLENFSSNPYDFGFNLGFTWKSLNFSAQFAGGFGGYALMNKNDYAFPTNAANGLKMWADHWTLDNPNASMPRAATSSSDELNSSTFWIRNGAELRLRNASISYAVPRTVYTKAGLSDLRVYVSATNLFTLISPYDYKDPQLTYFDSYPIMRTINFGLNLSF